MATYFEVKNTSDNSIVIDDAYKNLELLEIVELSKNAKKVKMSSGYVYYTWSHSQGSAVVYGIGLSELSGKTFCVTIRNGRIDFFDNTAKTGNARDDIISVGKIYVFGYGDNSPTSHMAGMEIYNSSGKIVYSSNKRYLNVLYCGGDETSTVSFSGTAVAIELGYDYYTEIYIDHNVGTEGVSMEMHPYFTVTSSAVSIKKRTISEYYVTPDEIDHSTARLDFHAGYTYGYMIANIL